MGYKKGESGNPAGRKPGTGKLAKLRQQIESELPEIIETLIGSAKAGDTQASKVLLERVVPALKPTEIAVKIDLSGDLIEKGETVLQAIGSGTLTPAQGQSLLAALQAQARLIESVELAERVAYLEKLMAVK